MYSNSTFLTPSISNSCLYVLNNRLPGLARYLQAVLIVSKFLEDLINLKLNGDVYNFCCLLGVCLSVFYFVFNFFGLVLFLKCSM